MHKLAALQGISAVAADGRGRGGPTQLALAVRPSRRTTRVMVFQLTGGAAGSMTARLLGQADVPSALPIQVSLPASSIQVSGVRSHMCLSCVRHLLSVLLRQACPDLAPCCLMHASAQAAALGVHAL
jgi:hypothetical protein